MTSEPQYGGDFIRFDTAHDKWCAWGCGWGDHQSGSCPVLEADRQKMHAAVEAAKTVKLPPYEKETIESKTEGAFAATQRRNHSPDR